MRLIESASGGGGAGYDAVAYSMIETAASNDAIQAGWLLAGRNNALGSLLFSLNGVASSVTDFASAALDAAARATLLADSNAAAVFLGDSDALTAISGDATALNAVIDDAVAFGTAFSASSDGAKRFRNAIWASDTACGKLLAQSVAHDAARAGGLLHSKLQNGTSPTDLTTGVTGGNLSASNKYLVLGSSYNNGYGTPIDMTLATLRSGSARDATGAWLGVGGASTTADNDICVPIEGATLTFAVSSAFSAIIYLRVLDCTAPA